MVALRKLFVLAAFATLTGCAASGSSEFARSAPAFENDADYMYAVESIARQKGVQVVWINPPSETGKDYVHHVK